MDRRRQSVWREVVADGRRWLALAGDTHHLAGQMRARIEDLENELSSETPNMVKLRAAYSAITQIIVLDGEAA